MKENKTLLDRIVQLEQQIKDLQTSITDINKGTTEKYIPPTSFGGGQEERTTIKPLDTKIGFGRRLGGSLTWHTGELQNPPVNDDAPNPEDIADAKGYNKHTHSRYSGGALIKGGIEIVEYVADELAERNIHSQSYWPSQPSIVKEINSNNETVDHIGQLNLVFNPDTKEWGTTAHEIDVKKCYLVIRDTDGNIELDSKGQEKKSLLYSEDDTKTSVVWDENGKCFRLFAVYASGS